MQPAAPQPVRAFILAPAILGWGLQRLVESADPRLQCCGSASTAPAACQSLERNPAHVAVIAVECEDDLAALALVHAQGSAKCIVLMSIRDSAIEDRAVLSGARGVVRTSDPPGALLKAIDKVNEGELWIDRGATSRIFLEMARQKAAEGEDPEKSKIATLTQRERQTIAAVATRVGAPAKAIARELCISEHTLRNHLTSIYSKLEVSNRLELHAFATRHRLTELR